MSIDFLQAKKQFPDLGVGLGLRRELAHDISQNHDAIDWLELCPENYMEIGGQAEERLDQAIEAFPLISHGINLSIGSADPLNQDYLRKLKKLLDRVNSAWWSDHLCFTSVGGRYLHDLLPLPLTKEALTHIVERIKYVQAFIGRPFLIENISYYMSVPGAEMTEAQFLCEILERADCGLLLDVNNVYVNSLNHAFDPFEYINQLPLERVAQIHVAGHSQIDDVVIDTHGMPVIEPVFQLLRHVLAKTHVNAILLERDQNFPPFTELIAELSVLREMARRASAQSPSPVPGAHKKTNSRPVPRQLTKGKH
jgi:uncharacterized protein